MEVKNLTPHDINIIGGATIQPEEVTPRLTTTIKVVGELNVGGIEILLTHKVFGKVEDLPEKQEGVLLIVSALVATALPERDDLIIPNVVRDSTGKIIGCDGFSLV